MLKPVPAAPAANNTPSLDADLLAELKALFNAIRATSDEGSTPHHLANVGMSLVEGQEV